MEPPCWRFKPLTLLVEGSKILMGIAYAVQVLAQACYSAFEGLHQDLTAHYNHLHRQDEFRLAVTDDLEHLPTEE